MHKWDKKAKKVSRCCARRVVEDEASLLDYFFWKKSEGIRNFFLVKYEYIDGKEEGG